MRFSRQDGSIFSSDELKKLNDALADIKENGIDHKLDAVSKAGVDGLQIAYVSLDGNNIGSVKDNKIFGVPLADTVVIANARLGEGCEIEFSGKNIKFEKVVFLKNSGLALSKDHKAEKAGMLHFKGCSFPEGIKEGDSEEVKKENYKNSFRLIGRAERLVLENTWPNNRSHSICQEMFSLRGKDGHHAKIEFVETSRRGRMKLSPETQVHLYSGSLFKRGNAPEITDWIEKKIRKNVSSVCDKAVEELIAIKECCKVVYQRRLQLEEKDKHIIDESSQLADKKGFWVKLFVNHKLRKLSKEQGKVREELKLVDDELGKLKVKGLKAENVRREMVAKLEGGTMYTKCRSASFSVEEGIVFNDGSYSEKAKTASTKEMLYLPPSIMMAKFDADLRFLERVSSFATEYVGEIKDKLYRFLDRLGVDGEKEYADCPQLGVLDGVYDGYLTRSILAFYKEMAKKEVKKTVAKVKVPREAVLA